MTHDTSMLKFHELHQQRFTSSRSPVILEKLSPLQGRYPGDTWPASSKKAWMICCGVAGSFPATDISEVVVSNLLGKMNCRSGSSWSHAVGNACGHKI